MTTYATQAGPKKHFFHPQWSLILTNRTSKFTQLTIMFLCGYLFKQSWADLWTQPEIVGVDFRTRTEIGAPTLDSRKQWVRGVRIKLSVSCHPITFWQFIRMWRVVDAGR
jgi:hypothetical protein